MVDRWLVGNGAEEESGCGPSNPARRVFLKSASAGTVIVATGVAGGPASAAVSAWRPDQPVLSFYLDQPWVDPTGKAQPYQPPIGARSGDPASRLSEEEARRLNISL